MLFDGATRHAEVQYFFQMNINSECRTLTLVLLYSAPDTGMRQESCNRLLVCWYQGDAAFQVVDAKSILSVVAMPPLPLTAAEILCNGNGKFDNLFYVCDKPGLEMMHYAGADEDMGGEPEQNVDNDGD
jgi:hypothetical protein